MTKSVFATLTFYDDREPRSAAMNMAIDEALLRSTCTPAIRFYRWARPSLSFGYFGNFSDVAHYQSERDIVRRWTGGGIVFHGDDLTYSIVVPRNDAVFAESSMSIYDRIHGVIRKVLSAIGQRAELATVAAVYDRRNQTYPAVADRRYSKHECFATPVRGDVLIGAQKIAGAAQRRTRVGLLQQGSIQHVDLADDFGATFARALCPDPTSQELTDVILHHAAEIAAQKYNTRAWLERR